MEHIVKKKFEYFELKAERKSLPYKDFKANDLHLITRK